MKQIQAALSVFLLLFASTAYSNPITNDQAIASVEQTAQALGENALQTLARINKGEHPYKNKDNPARYVFVLDTELTIWAHPHKTKIVGKNMKGKTDVKGKAFRDEFLTVTRKNGSGWVDYYYDNPKTKKMEHKTAFVKLVKGSNAIDYIVGCGKYFGE